ncbi:MAG: carbohydrate ABC transporter permease, partial [Bacilli bacterium]|nr:carbohydrate ABC transporter permease [Bacilli bacterium]
FKIFFSIGLPMVSPMLVVLGITTFMWNYSNFMWTVFAIPTNSDAYTLAKVLGDLISAGSNNANLYPQMLAASVLTSLPLIIIFFFLQRFIFEGISLGGVKE